jgi:hypothetical protein
MTLHDTTVQSRSPLLSRPTEVQEDARAEVYRIEDLYREGRKLRLQFARLKMFLQSGRRS